MLTGHGAVQNRPVAILSPTLLRIGKETRELTYHRSFGIAALVLATSFTAMTGHPGTRASTVPGASFSHASVTERAVLSGGVVYGAVLAPSGPGYVEGSTVFSLDPTSGDKLWSVFLGSAQPELTVAAGSAYIVWDGSAYAGIYALNATTGTVLWKVSWKHSEIVAAPVVSDSSVYIDFHEGPNRFNPGVCALDATTGHQLWCHGNNFAMAYSPAVAGGAVYTAGDGFMVSLNASTGAQNWSKPVKAASSAPVVVGTTVFFGASYEVAAVSTATGSTLWTYPTRNLIGGLAAGADTLYISEVHGVVDAVPTAGGDSVWTYKAPDVSAPSLLLDSGTLYAAGGNPAGGLASIASLNPTTGAANWTHTTSTIADCEALGVQGGMLYLLGDPTFLAVDASTGSEGWSFVTTRSVASAPVVSGGSVYAGASDDHVYDLDAATGVLNWRFRTNGAVLVPVAVSGTSVYALASWPDNSVYALDATTGVKLWVRTFADESITSTIAADGNGVYLGSQDGDVYALNPATGAIMWTHRLADGQTPSSVISVNGVLYLSSVEVCGCGKQAGFVIALREATGTKLWSFSVAEGPSPLAVQNGAVYATSVGGSVYAINASTGHKIWKHGVKAKGWVSITADGSAVYAVSLHGVVTLQASNGHKMWAESEKAVVRSVAFDGTAAYIGAGKVYALNAGNGHTLWSAGNGDGAEASSSGTAVFMAALGPRIGGIYSLDPATGQTNWSFATGQMPN